MRVSLLEINPLDPGIGPIKVGVQIQCLAVFCYNLPVLFFDFITPAQSIQPFRLQRIQIECFVVFLNGAFVIALCCIGFSQGEIRLAEVGVEADGFFQVIHGRRMLPHDTVGITQPVLSFGIIGVRPDRLKVSVCGLLELF